jgi:hypothetical protein
MKSRDSENQNQVTNNDHQKVVSGTECLVGEGRCFSWISQARG